MIKEINLYDYEPFNLPDSICFRFGKGGRKRHYYCFVVARVRDEERRRGGGAGYWKRTGRVRDVVLGDVVIGTRRAFVFYLGDLGKGGARTDWFMYEYALVEPHLVRFGICSCNVCQFLRIWIFVLIMIIFDVLECVCNLYMLM